MVYHFIRPALFALEPETAHGLAMAALRLMPTGKLPAADGPLITKVAGLTFPNPVGMAAGFDKGAQVPGALLRLGFGFAEVGSITPFPQAGNPRPRLFRLAKDGAIINRMGFNNDGAAAVATRLAAQRAHGGIIGINIGANKDSPDRITDYAQMARTMAPFASYLAVNVSSPNTPGLRELQDEGALAELLAAVTKTRDEGSTGARPPLFLKVAPDLVPAEIDTIARIALEWRIDALIVANTTVSRPSLSSRHAPQAGGLSGAPLKPLALAQLRAFRSATGGALPLIGVGGIATAEDAWERIRCGASLVQLYSAMIYEGPAIARHIVKGMERLMRRDGFTCISDAVGTA